MKNNTNKNLISKNLCRLAIAAALSGSFTATPLFAGSTSSSGLPNPASLYCIESRGEILVFADAVGNQFGFCKFGRAIVDEWILFRAASLGESPLAIEAYKSMGRIRIGLSAATNDRQPPVDLPNPSAVTCIDKGGDYGSLKAVTNGSEISTCSFSDRSSIDAWTLFYGPFDPANENLNRALGIAPR